MALGSDVFLIVKLLVSYLGIFFLAALCVIWTKDIKQ